MFDVVFIEFYQRTKEKLAEMTTEVGKKAFMPRRDFQKYKAVIELNGNVWSSRFPELLYQNSVVLKVDYMFGTYLNQIASF